jgi:hypothetical protein
MIGQLYATGIEIQQMYPGTENKWIGIIKFEDESHAVLGGVKGSLSNKYGDDLLVVCRLLLADAEKMGITMFAVGEKQKLYVTKLFVNNRKIYEQMCMAADALDFEVCNCLPNNEILNNLV